MIAMRGVPKISSTNVPTCQSAIMLNSDVHEAAVQEAGGEDPPPVAGHHVGRRRARRAVRARRCCRARRDCISHRYAITLMRDQDAGQHALRALAARFR